MHLLYHLYLLVVQPWWWTLFIQIAASLVIFVAILLVLVLVLRKPMQPYRHWDETVFHYVQRWTNQRRSRWMLVITFLDRPEFLVPANLVWIGFLAGVKHQPALSIGVIAVSVSSLLLMLLLKTVFGRARPLSPLLNKARGLSFPSGHAMMSVSFFGLMIYWIGQSAILVPVIGVLLIALLATLIILIAFSRIYLRVHYASDVIAGLLIGLVWLIIALLIVSKTAHPLPIT